MAITDEQHAQNVVNKLEDALSSAQTLRVRLASDTSAGRESTGAERFFAEKRDNPEYDAAYQAARWANNWRDIADALVYGFKVGDSESEELALARYWGAGGAVLNDHLDVDGPEREHREGCKLDRDHSGPCVYDPHPVVPDVGEEHCPAYFFSDVRLPPIFAECEFKPGHDGDHGWGRLRWEGVASVVRPSPPSAGVDWEAIAALLYLGVPEGRDRWEAAVAEQVTAHDSQGVAE